MSTGDSNSRPEAMAYVLENNHLMTNEFSEEELQEGQYDDMVYTEGPQTIVVHNGEAYVLQDTEENFGSLIISDEVDESQSSDHSQKNVFQYIQQNENGEQVIYEISDQNAIQLFQNQGLITQNAEGDDTSNSMELPIYVPELKTIKLEQPEEEEDEDQEGVHFQLIQDSESLLTDPDQIPSTSGNSGKKYQFAILKDNKLQVHTIDPEEMALLGTQDNCDEVDSQLRQELAVFEESIKMQPLTSTDPELLHITGKNLITGQVVTLDNYFDKICNNNRKINTSKDHYMHRMLNRKINLGRTKNGKKLVGKIISIQKPIAMEESGIMEDRTSNILGSLAENLEDASNQSQDLLIESLGHEQSNKIGDQEIFADEQTLSHMSEIEDPNRDNTTGSDVLMDDVSNEFTQESGHCYDLQEDETSMELDQQKVEDQLDEHMIVLDHTVVVSGESLNFIKKTLEGLMQMESIEKKIMYKKLQVKLIEKRYHPATDTFKKSICYTFGRMEMVHYEGASENEKGKMKWSFVVDLSDTDGDDSCGNVSAQCTEDETTNNNLASGVNGLSLQVSEDSVEKSSETNGSITTDQLQDLKGFSEITSIVMINTINKGGSSSLKVKLNPLTTAPTCKICNRLFKTPAHLRKHFLWMHQDDKSFMCSSCEMTFPDIQTLNRHQKTHEKWLTCHICNRSFSSHGSLKRHLTVHDKNMRSMECNVCNSKFMNEYNLKKHLVIHGGSHTYNCDTCHRHFAYQRDLNFHKSVKLKCKICGREFSRYSNLVRHEEIHRGEGALYKCDICGCSYNYVSSLTRHMVQNHIKHQQPQVQ